MSGRQQLLPPEVWLLICEYIREVEPTDQRLLERFFGRTIHEDLPQFSPRRSNTIVNLAMVSRQLRVVTLSEAYKYLSLGTYDQTTSTDTVNGRLAARITSMLKEQDVAYTAPLHSHVRDVIVTAASDWRGPHRIPEYLPPLLQLLPQFPHLTRLSLDNAILTDAILDLLPTLPIKHLFLYFCMVKATPGSASRWSNIVQGELQSLAIVGCVTLVQDFWPWIAALMAPSVTEAYLSLHDASRSVDWPALPNLRSLGLIGYQGKINRVAAGALTRYPNIEKLTLRGELPESLELSELPHLRSLACHTMDVPTILERASNIREVSITGGRIAQTPCWNTFEGALRTRCDTVEVLKLGDAATSTALRGVECLSGIADALPHLQHLALPQLPLFETVNALLGLSKLRSVAYPFDVPAVENQTQYLQRLNELSDLREVSFISTDKVTWRRTEGDWHVLS